MYKCLHMESKFIIFLSNKTFIQASTRYLNSSAHVDVHVDVHVYVRFVFYNDHIPNV